MSADAIDEPARLPSLVVRPGSVSIVLGPREERCRTVEIDRGGADFDAEGRLADVELSGFAHKIPGLVLDAHVLKSLAEELGCVVTYHPDADALVVRFADGATCVRSDWGAGSAEVGERGNLVTLTVEADFSQLAPNDRRSP